MLQYEAEYGKKGADEYTGIMHTTPNTIEIIQTISGSGTVQIEKSIYPMANGDIYIINMDNMHCTAPDNAEEYVRNKIFINNRFLYNLLRMANDEDSLDEIFFKSSGTHISLSPKDASFFDILCKQLLQSQNKGTLYQLSVLTRILDFCTSFIQFSFTIENDHIRNAVDYIQTNFEFPLSVDNISEAVYISKYYLCREFKKCTGMTVMEYVSECRLQAAKKKLLYGNEKISEIANLCGYSSFSIFSKQFKRATGYSPSEYRQFFLNSIVE